jgi:hypothetical protein
MVVRALVPRSARIVSKKSYITAIATFAHFKAVFIDKHLSVGALPWQTRRIARSHTRVDLPGRAG